MRRSALAALLLFAILSLLLTYPLSLHLADAVEDRQDALLNVWITAWDGHQLLSDPLHLFDANIFHTYPRTLAYSELLLGNGLLALPITAATGNPILGYNVALLLSFVLSGFGTYLLLLRLTQSPGAGVVAGLIFAFCSYRMTNLAQAQLLTTQWMPFALLALHQLVRDGRPRCVATFVLFFSLQALSSFYYAPILALAVGGYLLWLLVTEPSTRSRRALLALLIAVCCCALVILPFALPYLQVQHQLGFERTLADSEPFSASLRQYVMVPPGSVLGGTWLPSDDTPVAGGYPVDALFPGFIAVALGVWGLVAGRGRARWFFFLLLLGSVVLSLGPRLYLRPGQPSGLEITLPYAWLYAVVPGFKALRAPVRFDALVMLALAVLAGYGTAALIQLSERRWWRLGVPTLFAVAVILGSWVWPAARAEFVAVGDDIPPVYGWLADQPPGPVVELPMAFTAGGPQLEYQYFSTYHWQTTPDGYSGFVPAKHGQIVYEMERFPSERSVSLLQALDVGTLVIHTDGYPPGRWLEMQDALARVDELSPIASFDADQVYELRPRTFDTHDLEVSAHLPPRAAAGQPYTAYLIVINRGPRSYAVQPTDLVQASAVWSGPQGQIADTAGADVPLVISPDGGAAVIPLPLMAPAVQGTYALGLSEPAGVLGTWSAEGGVAVGGEEEEAETRFPIPVQLASSSVPPEVHPGEPLEVQLTWRALGKIDAYYSVYAKLLDAEGQAIAAWDGQPRDGEAPTLEWVPGTTIEDSVVLAIPVDASPGAYTVEAGVYRAHDLARCLTLDSEGGLFDRLDLGIVQIVP